MERRDKLLTLSIAAYHVEKTLSTTMNSLLVPEILDKIEIIIVDDGSKDGTNELAQEYGRKYPDVVKVISKENGGHGSTINAGVDNATGLFFKTIDGDDLVKKEGYLKLISFIEEVKNTNLTPDIDIISTPYDWIDFESGEKIKNIDESLQNVEYKKIYNFYDISDEIYVNMHAMTYRTELLKKHLPEIDKHCFYVDAEYVLLPVPYVNRIVFLEDSVYQYRLGRDEQSMNLKNMQKNCAHHEKVLRRILAAYEEQNHDTHQARQKAVCSYLAKGAARLAASQVKIYLSYNPSKENKRKIVELQNMLKEKYPEVYGANRNKAVELLRKSRYLLYGIAARLVR